MFKKTLLALSVAAIASTATAGTIYSTVTESTTAALTLTTGVGTPSGTNTTLGGGDEDCLLAAAELGVTADLATFTNGVPAVATVSDGDDTITDGTVVVAGTFTALASSVTFTANDACTVVVGESASVTAVSSSIEAAQNVAVPANATLVAGIGGYQTGDTITFAISGASIDVVTSTTPTLSDTSGTPAGISILDITPSLVRFTVNSGNVSGSGILNLTGINLDATGLSSTTEVQYNAFATNTSGTDFDVSSGVVIADLVPQYSATVTAALDGIIDVSNERQSLAVNASDNTTGENVDEDTLTVAVSLDASGTIITPATVSYEITGDFTWLDASADSSADATAATPTELATYLTTGFYAGTGDDTFLSATLNATLDTLTVVTTAVGGDVDTVSNFLFPVQGLGTGNEVLNETSYGVTIIASDATASPNTITMSAGTSAAGAWTLNGSVVTVPYMPFDANTAVIMRHTNTGVQTGDITVRYMLEGVSTAWTSAGVVASSSRGVMNIRDAVMDAIMADAGVTAGKVAIEITTNVPAADVTVYAAYKVKDEQDRGFVGTFGQHGSAN